MVKHEGTLDNYGQDPTDPMARNPVGADISLSTYGSYWKFASRNASQLFYTLERSAFSYKAYSAAAPDNYGSYNNFGFQSYYLWLVSKGNIDIDYTINNINTCLIIESTRQHILPLCANGFRIRNSVPGTNIPYQLVVFR